MVVLYGTRVNKERLMATASMSKRRQEGGDETAVRERILEAAFAAFMMLMGRPAELAEQFGGLLWRDLLVSLLLGVAERPNPREIAGRARDAAAAFLQLHPLANDGQL